MIINRCIKQKGIWLIEFIAGGVRQQAIGSKLKEVIQLACNCATAPLESM